MSYQRNRRIGFVGSFDAAWSDWSEITNPILDSSKKRTPGVNAALDKLSGYIPCMEKTMFTGIPLDLTNLRYDHIVKYEYIVKK